MALRGTYRDRFYGNLVRIGKIKLENFPIYFILKYTVHVTDISIDSTFKVLITKNQWYGVQNLDNHMIYIFTLRGGLC